MLVTFKEEGASWITILLKDTPWKTVNKQLFRKDLSSLRYAHSEEELKESFTLMERNIAKRYALFCVSKQSLFSLQLRKKLQAKGFSEIAIGFAIDFCIKIQAISDDFLAEKFLERKMKKGFSEKFAKRSLHAKSGTIAKNLPQKGFENAVLNQLLEKKFSKTDWKDAKQVQKTIRFFLRRGFSIELIRKALEEKTQGAINYFV